MKYYLTLSNDNRYGIHSEKELKKIEKSDMEFDGFSSLTIICELDAQKIAEIFYIKIKPD